MTLRYLSVCSGIEAATQAWHGLGWQPVAFSEIEKFPSAVLAHHYPGTPNWGDMTKFQEWPDADIDVLCGGTPCQSFSVAGLRQGLADPRGNLTLTYLAIAQRYRPKWVVWENVPGVFSSTTDDIPDSRPPEIDLESGDGPEDGTEVVVEDEHDGHETHALGSFLAGLSELGYGVAYRVLDAQYVRTRRSRRAVPQRRRRVFVVGYLGDWRRAAAVLFDAESLRRDPPPRREAGQRPAPTISARPTGGGGLGTDFVLDGGLIANSGDVGYCLTDSAQQSLDAETETLVLQVAPTLRGRGFDATDDGTGKGTPIIPVCFDSKGSQVQTDETGAAPTLRAMTHADSHQNGGGQLAVAYSIQAEALRENPDAGPDGVGVQEGHAYTLEARAEVQAIAWSLMPQNSGKDFKARAVDVAQPSMAAGPGGGNQGGDIIQPQPWAVRRLTPVECERLMDFPDGFTAIPWRKKPASACPDGPRYKALGNSWAVNVAEWVGERIAEVDAWPENETRAARPTNGVPHADAQ